MTFVCVAGLDSGVPVRLVSPPVRLVNTFTFTHQRNSHPSSIAWRDTTVIVRGISDTQISAKELKREEHKLYDEAIITVKSPLANSREFRAGRGGNGEIVEERSGKYVKNYKYNPGGRQPKTIWLPAAAPADGGSGGDIVLKCDGALDSLMHFHVKNTFTAKRGPHGNPEEGSQGSKSLSPTKRPRHDAPPFFISVPPGTAVKRKGTGRFLGELISPGDELTVAKGGNGGYGAVKPSKKKRPVKKKKKSKVQKIEVETSDWKEDVQGLPGEEMMLQLILRVVADVGFVGLPNAGKSSLLASLSRARPEIAPYPFTTLIPNLGVMGCGGDPVLVDLPGLIEGAHVGRGLGRNFLRHLRRTRMLLQVIDASLPDPVTDYETIREELRMYNPQYCERLHLVALNKIDLVQSPERLGEMMDGIRGVAQNLRGRCPSASVPSHIILTNALEGTGADEVQRAIEEALRDGRVEETGWGEWDE